MTLTLDAVGPGSSGQAATLAANAAATWSHTCTGSQRILFVGVAVSANLASLASVTYNGVAMTRIITRQSNDQTAGGVHLYGLINPASGTHTVSVTPSTTVGTDYEAGSVSYTGADQTTGWKNATSNAGSVSGGTHPITGTIASTTTGNIVIAAACYGSAITAGAGVGTNRWANNQNPNSAAGNAVMGDNAVTSSSTQVAWDSTSGDWFGWVGVEIMAASSGASGAMTASATAQASFGGTATHKGTLTAQATAVVAFNGKATHFARNTMQATAVIAFGATTTHRPAFSTAATAQLTLNGTTTHRAALVMSATAQLTLAAKITRFRTLTMSAGTAFTVAVSGVNSRSLALSATAQLVLAGKLTSRPSLSLTAGSSVVFGTKVTHFGVLVLSSTAQLQLHAFDVVHGILLTQVTSALLLSAKVTELAAFVTRSTALIGFAATHNAFGSLVFTSTALLQIVSTAPRHNLPPAVGKVTVRITQGSVTVRVPQGNISVRIVSGKVTPGRVRGVG